MASSLNSAHSIGVEPNARHPRGAGLLLFDLDDTLIQAGSYVSPRVIAALRAAREHGYVLSVSTGRPLCSVHKAILSSGAMDFAVCSNGATVTQLGDGCVLASRLMSTADALDCYEIVRAYRPAWNAFIDGRALFEWRGASYMLTGRTGAVARSMRSAQGRGGIARRVARLGYRGIRYVWRMVTNPSHRQVVSVLPHLRRASSGVEKMGCTIADARACDKAACALCEDGRFEVVRVGGNELEITAKGVTKGTGAATLMRHLGFDAGSTWAFGDGENDLALCGVVGCFVAMGNACPEVRARADAVCPPVGDDGVATWIDANLLSQAEGRT